VATVGALLPVFLRIRHPRSQLTYYHAILLLCFALPMIQPWQESLAIVAPGAVQVPPQVDRISWGTIAAGILLLGILAKLSWLGVGLWQLRRYRKFAVPLSPTPEPIREAVRLVGVDALFCLSRDVTGPATVGHIDPIVLLPHSFQSLDADAQRSIACHELLHVRRKDWLITILEELSSALLWFNPGVWWVLAQAKLSREQLVDSEVVKLTAREPYVHALLSIAVVSRRRWALPAASFFTKGHLIQRMRSLLKESRCSSARLLVSYATASFLLAVAVGAAILWLPLMGEAQTITLSAPRSPAPFLFRLHGPEFTVRVPAPAPAPERQMGTVEYFEAPVQEGILGGVVGGADPLEDHLHFMPPPPPPPAPPGEPFGFLGARGFRIVRPGQKVSAEEVERLRNAFGNRAEVEVIQSEDGTVQRVTVTGRRPQ
jgi:beta-lactamase regulating signal transducer with metallopeptidase domain